MNKTQQSMMSSALAFGGVAVQLDEVAESWKATVEKSLNTAAGRNNLNLVLRTLADMAAKDDNGNAPRAAKKAMEAARTYASKSEGGFTLRKASRGSIYYEVAKKDTTGRGSAKRGTGGATVVKAADSGTSSKATGTGTSSKATEVDAKVDTASGKWNGLRAANAVAVSFKSKAQRMEELVSFAKALGLDVTEGRAGGFVSVTIRAKVA